ncbi:methyltransferase domain-containing protein [Rhodobacterales bacterium HKCCE2091]|nr:methyltransferase domain-containing protein [Rhodobacterales bacterium HKCCE2091]
MMDKRLRRHEYGFLELVDPPSDAELADYYANKYYQSETGSYRKTYPPEELRAIDLRVTLRAAAADRLRGSTTPGRMLDVGCGEGFVMARYAAAGWEVEGVDHSNDGVAGMNPELLPRVTQGNLFEIVADYAESGRRYDLVWLGNVLEHVLRPVELLRSLRGLVAPGGLLVVTVPNDGSRYQEDLFETGTIPERFWIAIPDHISYFTRDSLTATAEATGWDVRDIHADFPIDLFLSHPGSNYVADRSRGPAAHAARLRLEGLIGDAGPEAANAFYSALAGVGLGRNMTAFLAPSERTPE